jgi:hypothetical protein
MLRRRRQLYETESGGKKQAGSCHVKRARSHPSPRLQAGVGWATRTTRDRGRLWWGNTRERDDVRATSIGHRPNAVKLARRTGRSAADRRGRDGWTEARCVIRHIAKQIGLALRQRCSFWGASMPGLSLFVTAACGSTGSQCARCAIF